MLAVEAQWRAPMLSITIMLNRRDHPRRIVLILDGISEATKEGDEFCFARHLWNECL
jgi:hypothetical protein